MHKKNILNIKHTQALLECLRSSPLLVDDLPEAVCFDRCGLFDGELLPELNYAQKLGHLYEDALEFLLSEASRLELIKKGIQIFGESRITLGELDYLVRDVETCEVIHLELAVKFYLVRYVNGEPVFPGPDPRDNWINKLNRLRTHQLQLAQSSFAKDFLLDEFGIGKITTQQLIYGKVFDHYLAAERPCPPAMRRDCQRGTWKYLSEWLCDSEKKNMTIIPKYLWPVDLSEVVSGLGSISREEFLEKASTRCVMVWNAELSEAQFIAPDNWQ